MDAGNNETEYVLTESYELSDWDSDSVSFSIGYSTEFNFLGGKASIETGYALDWTKSFERSLHEEWSQSFSAQAYNSVVVSRTPVFVYEYDIQKAFRVSKAKRATRVTKASKAFRVSKVKRATMLTQPRHMDFTEDTLRHTMPSGVCSYCVGETRVGTAYQQGVVGKIDFKENAICKQ